MPAACSLIYPSYSLDCGALLWHIAFYPNNSNTINAQFQSCQTVALLLGYRENLTFCIWNLSDAVSFSCFAYVLVKHTGLEMHSLQVKWSINCPIVMKTENVRQVYKTVPHKIQ